MVDGGGGDQLQFINQEITIPSDQVEEVAKKVLFLIAVPLMPPPSLLSFMAVGTLSKKVLFSLMDGPYMPLLLLDVDFSYTHEIYECLGCPIKNMITVCSVQCTVYTVVMPFVILKLSVLAFAF